MSDWSAQFTAVKTNTVNANVDATFVFTNAATNEVQTRTFPANDWTPETIAIWAQSYITALETRDATLAAMQASLASGPVPIELPRDGFPTPVSDAALADQAQARKIAVLTQQLSQLNVLQAAATAGLIAADDPALVAAQATVQQASGVKTSGAAQPASP